MIGENEANSSEEKITVRIDADLQDIVPGFLEHRYDDIRSMLEAVEHGDYDTVRFLGHSMKGSGGGYGFHAITDIGQSLEQAANQENSNEVRKLVSGLSTYLEHVEVVYE